MALQEVRCVKIVLPEILYYTLEELGSLPSNSERVFYLLPRNPRTSNFKCSVIKSGVLRLSPSKNEYNYRYSVFNKKPSLVIDSINKEESADTMRALAKIAVDMGCQGLVIEQKMIKFLKLV
jgi:hypothetical protein